MGLRFKLENAVALWQYLPRVFRLIWAAAPRWTMAWASLLIVQGLLPAATVYLTGLLVDSLVATVEAGGTWASLRPFLILAALMGAAMLLIELLKEISEYIRTAQAEYIRDYIKKIIHEKSTSVDLAYYEFPDYYDRLHRAQNDSGSRPLSLLESSGSLVQNSITLLAMAAILIPYGLWLPLVLILSTVPAFVIVLRFDQRYHQWWEETTAARRWTSYYSFMLTNRVAAPELRLFELGAYFQNAFQSLRQRLRAEQLQLTKERGLGKVGAGLLGLLIFGLAIGWMTWRTVQGQATLGELARFYQAFNRGQSLMRTLLQNAGQIYSNSLFLGNLFEFLELETRVVDSANPRPVPKRLASGIEFKQVTFRYAESKRAILADFSLAIPAGQIVAIVGPNGAGKSTLAKLLCRFYDPSAGSIELDGLDLRQISLSDLRRFITVLFQFPIAYHATAAENIVLGDVQATPAQADIETAARGAGAHEFIDRLPQGYDTLVGKWFAEGVELSGGEWQRLALARAFLKQAHILILDEPTSFMDSWAEMAWLARFRELAKGKTAVIITHRFTTAMQADVIHVMDEGKIIESGSHAELLAANGRYARSWQAQMGAGDAAPVAGAANGARYPSENRPI